MIDILNKFNSSKIKAHLILFLLLGVFLQANAKNSNESVQQLTIPADTDITTKIYKSSDKSNDILLNNVGGETTFSDDIISKEGLLHGDHIAKNKHLTTTYFKINTVNPILPWVSLVILVILQSLIFRIINNNKI